MSLSLRNPHSVLAVLQTRPEDVLQLAVPARGSHEHWEACLKLARSRGVHCSSSMPKQQQSGRAGSQSENQRFGLAEAVVKERPPVPLEELFASSAGSLTSGGQRGLWLALDSLQDPQNVGAIFRSAAFFGVKGIIVTQERSAPLSSAVYDVASGGMEYVPFTLQVNLQRAFEVAKKSDLWILGSSEHAHDDVESIPLDRSWLLVLGNEEKGMRRLTEESCDMLCKVSSRGQVGSLNVGTAAGILISRLA